MRKTLLFSVVLAVFSFFTGCQTNETNSQSENVNMTTETVTESVTSVMNSVDYHSVYDSYLFDTLIQTYGLSASVAENDTPDNLDIPHNELLGLVSAAVYDFGDDGASELLVLTRENAGDYCCNCYLTLYAYEQGTVVRKDRILLDEYVITSGGEHGDRFELGIYGDTIVQSLETRRYASYGPDALCNEYTFIEVADSTFSKFVLKANTLQVENKNYGEVIYHCEELCRNSMYGGCSDYSDQNDIEKADACISDLLSQKHFNCFSGIQLHDNQAIKLSFTKEPDVKICDYDRYAGFTTTDHTGFQEKALDAGYLPKLPVATEAAVTSSESSTATSYSYETYSAEMNICKKKGEISGVNVGGYIAVFNEQIGDYSYTGTTLENQQQIVAVRSYRYKDRTWYDLYDIDYNVYYGWVDEQYIRFYDKSIQTTSTSTTTSTTTTVITTTTEPVAASWQDAYRIALNNIRNSDSYESAYMWDLADLDGDTVPELLISSGYDRTDKVSIYYYDGKQAVLLDSNSDGKGDKFGEGGYMGFNDRNLMIESGYNYLGRSSYTYYRYHSDHTIERLKDFYTNEVFAKENGMLPYYKIDGEYVTPDFFYDIFHQMHPENYTGFTSVGRKYSFDDESALG